MKNYDKFIFVTNQLYNRYKRNLPNGKTEVITHIGGKRTLYQYFVDLASVKYLGCRPEKLKASYEKEGVIKC